MPRGLLGLLIGIPFVLAGAGLVQYEGYSYRRSLAEAGEESLRSRLVGGPPRRPAPAVELTVAPVAKEAKAAEARGPERERPTVKAEPAPEPEGPAPKPETIPEPVRPAPPAPREPKPEPRVVPPLPEFDVHKDPLALTADEERRLGQALQEVIVQRHQPLEAPGLERVLVEAARPLLAQRQRKEVEYRFTVLASDSLNVFSHPGGFIYVSRGLFDFIAEDAEWQFVIAHEIAHVDQKHDAQAVARAIQAAEKAGQKPPDLLAAFYRQIALGHDDAAEYDADARAFRLARRLGRSRRESNSFVRRLLSYAEEHSLSGRRKPATPPEAPLQDVENHWRSHPPALDRLEKLETLPPNP